MWNNTCENKQVFKAFSELEHLSNETETKR